MPSIGAQGRRDKWRVKFRLNSCPEILAKGLAGRGRPPHFDPDDSQSSLIQSPELRSQNSNAENPASSEAYGTAETSTRADPPRPATPLAGRISCNRSRCPRRRVRQSPIHGRKKHVRRERRGAGRDRSASCSRPVWRAPTAARVRVELRCSLKGRPRRRRRGRARNGRIS